jgi:hypothetical protein
MKMSIPPLSSPLLKRYDEMEEEEKKTKRIEKKRN